MTFAAFRQALAALPPRCTSNCPFSRFGTLFAEYPARHLTGCRHRSKTMTDRLFGIHAQALELRSQRMGLLASNIANAATPGYKARDIDFAAALKATQSGASVDKASSAAALYRVPVMPSLDGNTVELQTEQLAFSENAVGYSATLQFIKGRVDTVTRAIRGE
jgi:flagellar basal-body rod protein FlgB